jgi:hypothetical protein
MEQDETILKYFQTTSSNITSRESDTWERLLLNDAIRTSAQCWSRLDGSSDRATLSVNIDLRHLVVYFHASLHSLLCLSLTSAVLAIPFVLLLDRTHVKNSGGIVANTDCIKPLVSRDFHKSHL